MDETTTKTQNQNPTQEDKKDLETELMAEAQRNDRLVQEAISPLRTKIAALEEQLNKLNELYQLKEQELAGATAAYAYAVEDFRALALQANPFITPELVAGDTVEAVKANVAKANALVAKVKQSLEQQAATLTHLANVPAGAPGRTEPDLSALSTVEKINLGLEQAKKKK